MENFASTRKGFRKSALPLKLFESILVIFLGLSTLGCNWFESNRSRNVEQPEAVVAPTADFTASVVAGNVPLEVNFSDNSSSGTSPITSWQWDFGDGNTSSAQSPQHTYEEAGVYSVSLTVTTSDGNDTEQKADLISVAANDIPTKLSFTVVNTKGELLDGVTIESTDFAIVSQQASNLGTDVMVNDAEQDGLFKISKPGYINGYYFLEGIAVDHQQRVVLKQKSQPIVFNGFLGGEFFGEDGTGVEIPGESLVRPDGSTAVDEVELYITSVDVSDDLERDAFPGSYYGTTGIGEPQDQLFSYGVFDITFEENGEELQLADNRSAVLTLPLFATKSFEDEDLQVGDTIPLWYLDVETGLWIHEDDGTVVADPSSPNGLALRASTTHFTSFNSDINPPGLGRGNGSGGGGGGGGGGSTEDRICRLNIDLLGAELEKTYRYTIVYSRPGWPVSSNSRNFQYDGSAISQAILRGFAVTATVADEDNEGSITFFCNGQAEQRTITLGNQPPEIKDFNLRVEPEFTRVDDGEWEIVSNRVYIGGYWVGAEEGVFNSPLLDSPNILGRGIYREVAFESTDPNPATVTLTVSNEHGEDTAETTVNFISEQAPILGFSAAIHDPERQETTITWFNVEGADLLDIYYLENLSDPLGVVLQRDVNSSSGSGFLVFNDTRGDGFFRLEFSNQYGDIEEFIKISGSDCPPFSELCVPEN